MRRIVNSSDLLILTWDLLIEFILLIFLLMIAVRARLKSKPVDVGLGPEPIINNIYYAQSVRRAGYTAETFVGETYFITKDFDRVLKKKNGELNGLIFILKLFSISVMNYKILYIYFTGGPLANTRVLWRVEPYLLALSRVKVVVMPYGGDVQDLRLCKNALLRHAIVQDYPGIALKRDKISKKIDLWTQHADHVIACGDCIDYMYYWDSIVVSNLSINIEKFENAINNANPKKDNFDRPLRLLHAPNHRNIKGTAHFVRAVEDLKKEGHLIELELIQFAPNEEVLSAMSRSDVILDQLVIGWYGMFSLESMAMAKPVVCYLRPDLVAFYTGAGMLERDELPIIQADSMTVKDVLRRLLVQDREHLPEIGRRGRDYVRKHHSHDVMGANFSRINRALRVRPGNPSQQDGGVM